MTWANRFTTTRLLLGAALFGLFAIDRCGLETRWIPRLLPLIVLASVLTDLLDGRVARARGEWTGFGRLYDPFADTFFRFTASLCLWWLGWISAWMVAVLFLHDATVSFLRVAASGQEMSLRPWPLHRAKEVAQESGLLTGFVLLALSRSRPELPAGVVCWWLLLLVSLITLASMAQVIWVNRRTIASMEI